MMHKSTGNITHLPLLRAVLFLAIPMSLKWIGHFLFEVVDAYWVGRLGKYALAAVGGSSFYIWIYFSLVGITSIGTNTMLAQAIGADNIKKAHCITFTGLVSSCFFAFFWLAIYLSFYEFFLVFVGLKATSLQLAKDYLFLFIIASPLSYCWCFLEEIINAYGETHINFKITLLAIGLNIILDPLLIYGYGPFPCLGIQGAQLASIIATSLGVMLTLLYCLQHRYLSIAKFDWKVALQILSISLPQVANSGIFSITYLGLAYLIRPFGEEALAAWMIGHRLEGLPFFLSLGFATSASVMSAQHIGAGNQEYAKKSVYWNIAIVSAILAFNILFFLGFTKVLIAQFTTDTLVLNYGTEYLRIVTYTHIFLGWEMVFQGAFRGIGNTLPYMYIATPLTLARIPFAYFLEPFWGIQGIFWAISFSTLLKGILLCFFFICYGTRWMKQLT